jgi:hypothetical protein
MTKTMMLMIGRAAGASLMALLLPACDRLQSKEPPAPYTSTTLETAREIAGTAQVLPASAASAAVK